MIKKCLNRRADFGNSRFLALATVLLCGSFVHAQQIESHVATEKTAVFVTNGASLYSTDEAFNSQINVIVLKNDESAAQGNRASSAFHTSSSVAKDSKRNLKLEIKSIKDKKLKEELKKTSKEIASYQKRKESFKKCVFDSFPSQSQFFSTNSVSKSYIVPNHNDNSSFKIPVSKKDYSIKQALSYLHAEQYAYYNNRSLDYCFSQVYSVRPPPELA